MAAKDEAGNIVGVIPDMAAEMADRFPLREVTFAGTAVPCDPEEVLARQEDTILYLSDAEPA